MVIQHPGIISQDSVDISFNLCQFFQIIVLKIEMTVFIRKQYYILIN